MNLVHNFGAGNPESRDRRDKRKAEISARRKREERAAARNGGGNA
ncbi:MAG: hypothetical protein ACRDP6_29205 [Actinoallomurus sp.]